MSTYYLDTSALVKRYAHERGTDWMVSLLTLTFQHDVYTVRLTGPEMVAALFRKARTGEISQSEAIRAANKFRADWQRLYQIIEVSVDIADRAMSLVAKHALRGYDAVHLAAAVSLQETRRDMELPPLTFISADDNQLAAAQSEGLTTENPALHP